MQYRAVYSQWCRVSGSRLYTDSVCLKHPFVTKKREFETLNGAAVSTGVVSAVCSELQWRGPGGACTRVMGYGHVVPGTVHCDHPPGTTTGTTTPCTPPPRAPLHRVHHCGDTSVPVHHCGDTSVPVHHCLGHQYPCTPLYRVHHCGTLPPAYTTVVPLTRV